MSKGGINMQMKGWALTMGIGAAVGAVAVAMLPRNSAARKLVDKAAYAVEDAAQEVTDKITKKMDM
jgi:predicted thioredoxin/glutaredoxin